MDDYVLKAEKDDVRLPTPDANPARTIWMEANSSNAIVNTTPIPTKVFLKHDMEDTAGVGVRFSRYRLPFLWLLLFDSGMAIYSYRSHGDAFSVAFVVALVPVLSLHLLERAHAFFLQWKRKGFVLAPLRSHLPETAGGGSSAHDPRDTAWSRTRLIADSGATMHAVGNSLLLEGFRPYSPPLVATLADGSHLRILGIGRIQRGNFSIPNVCLVEGVQDGLISTPQLDTRHGLDSCFGNGVCRIMEADGTEVGGAVLEEGGSYVLRFLEVPGTAQV